MPEKWEEMKKVCALHLNLALRPLVTQALSSKKMVLLDRTPDLESLGKGDRVTEIREWLVDNVFRHITSWIVIDDLDLIKMNDKLPRDHFVKTNDDIGLTDELADKAVRKLSGGEKMRK